MQKAEGECLSLWISLPEELGRPFQKALTLNTLLAFWIVTCLSTDGALDLCPRRKMQWDGRTSSGVWHKWSTGVWTRKLLPLRNFQRSSPRWKWSLRYKWFTPPTCGYNQLCQRNSQNQLLHDVSLDLPFYTQQPKTKQAVAWQKPEAAWHHSTSMLLALAVANPRHREKEKERRRRRRRRQQAVPSFIIATRFTGCGLAF